MSLNNTKNIISSVIKALCVLAVAVYFIIICFNGLDGEFVEEEWQVTQGVILNTDLELSGHKNSERKKLGVEQIINYKYVIDDVEYQSNSVSPERFVFVNDYPEGKEVDVFYNPDDYEQTVLVRIPVQKHYLYGMIVFCFVSIGATGFFLVKDIKNNRIR